MFRKKLLIVSVLAFFVSTSMFAEMSYGYNFIAGMDAGTTMHRLNSTAQYNLKEPYNYLTFGFGTNMFMDLIGPVGLNCDANLMFSFISMNGEDRYSGEVEIYKSLIGIGELDLMPWVNFRFGNIGFGGGAGIGLCMAVGETSKDKKDDSYAMYYMNDFSTEGMNLFTTFVVGACVRYYLIEDVTFVVNGRYKQELSPVVITETNKLNQWVLDVSKILLYVGTEIFF